MPPAPGVRTSSAPRDQLIAEIRDQLARLGAPRLQLLLILVLAGTAAFLASIVGLSIGIASMALRYAIATVAGYVTFIALLRGWIAWQRRSWPDLDVDVDLLDVDFDLTRPGCPGAPRLCGGDEGGDGAAGTELRGIRADRDVPGKSGFDLTFDVDDLWPVLVAVTFALGGLVIVVYAVWTAPLLLAEVALDGAVFTAVYRRLHARDAAHWAATTIRRTWMLAATLTLFAAGCGFAFEWIAPDARSIGDVISALTTAR
jgi:hypothetical protein